MNRRKVMKTIFRMFMVSLFLLGLLPLSSMAAGKEQKTIEAFMPLPEAEQKMYIYKEDKPKLEEILRAMPKTLSVLTDEENWEPIEVQWYCVGDDYEDSDSYYFQFSPVWDEELYDVESDFQVIQDAPYVSVFLYENVQELSVTGNSNETIIYNFLINEMELNSAAACGVLANIYAESSFNPNALGDKGSSYGICQWHNTRWTAMKNWCNANGYNWETLTGQLNYLKFELSRNNSAYLWNGKTIYNYLKSVSNDAQGAYDAGYYWCYYFEVPANRETKSVTRGNAAKDTYWPEYHKEEPEEDNKESLPFVDVSMDAWYASAVQYVYDKGIIVGDGNIFAPDNPATRAMFVVILHRMENSPKVTDYTKYDQFTDLCGTREWYSEAIAWALNEGLTTGDSYMKLYNPNMPITREQLALFFWRYAQYKGEDVTLSRDVNEILGGTYVNDWALDGFAWAVDRALIKGSESVGANGQIQYDLLPQGGATRAQLARVLQRFLEDAT